MSKGAFHVLVSTLCLLGGVKTDLCCGVSFTINQCGHRLGSEPHLLCLVQKSHLWSRMEKEVVIRRKSNPQKCIPKFNQTNDFIIDLGVTAAMTSRTCDYHNRCGRNMNVLIYMNLQMVQLKVNGQ